MSDAELATVQTKDDPTVDAFINQIFSDTRIKLAKNDPVVMLYIAIHQMIKKEIAEYQDTMFTINTNFVDKTQSQLDYANEYFVGNIGVLENSLDEKTSKLLAQLDDKHKELNFILTKIQGEYDKQLDERFEKHFKAISNEQAQTIKKLQLMADDNLKRQIKNATSKQRDIMIGVGGFIVGLLICLLLTFILK
ncbi:hypothetical protein A9308_08960 [Moraxella atlantae]|uniref:Uncharacterized protein n=1 Tax=Faucicola atlantae TaxID=34059 RepID=A0A1B8QAJ1_9GAMM|nr:hypothetical protein [Moraxella atlantae]OBX76255.1 hypothetical protein A9308_08960 [Moraxella atlantae]